MSLRVRLLASVVLVLLASLGLGSASAIWNAARSVRTEMEAALAVGEQTVRNGFKDIAEARDPAGELTRLVRTFDGDRHLRAALLGASGQEQAASTVPSPPQALPGWFVRLVAPVLPPMRLPLPDNPGGGAFSLAAEPLNEVSEVWTQLRGSLATLTLSCGMGAVLVGLVVGRALRPLEQVSAALAAVGSGEYGVRLPEAGAPELVRLAEGFNAMAARLGKAEAQNRRLHEQLVTLQEEERADIARDLHDEVGPFLFTAALDAAAIEQGAAAGQHDAIAERARAVREAVGHMQRHVRGMLGRLRPSSPVEVGLRPALGNLIAFWQAHRPSVAFALEVLIDGDSRDEATQAVIYRVVQEGLSNAVRHGYPARIEVTVSPKAAQDVIVRVSDDGVGLMDGAQPGFGLAGMRERVEALGGFLQVATRAKGTGLTVTARLPGADGTGIRQAETAA